MVWSEEGSNRRAAEEDSVYCFDQFLIQAANGSGPCSLVDLLSFITGADRIPPNGFSRMIKVKFFDVESGEKRRPFASTCALELFIPRGIEESELFNDLMISAMKECIGFGKV